MSNQIAIPEHLKKFMTPSGVTSDADAMASSSLSFPRISLRGRKFRMIEGGEELRKPADELYAVILAVEPGAGLMQKTFYAKGYSSGDAAPPDCSSANGVMPDTWVSNPMSDRCQTCPKNQFGSATSNNGKKSKACKDSKRLWVAEPDNINGTVFNLGIPVTSLKALSEYGNQLKTNGIPAAAVITRLAMKDTEFPELTFEFTGVLEENTLNISMQRNESKDFIIGGQSMAIGHDGASNKVLSAPGANALIEGEAKTVKGNLSADDAAGNW